MNNLEFRSWDITDKEMIHNPSLFFDGTEYYVVVSSGFGDEWYRIGYEGCGYKYRFVLMQWTGLKDKDETKIFEGDVVVENGIKRVIKYGYYEVDELGSTGDYAYGFNLNPYCSRVLVIGNIYENPELTSGV